MRTVCRLRALLPTLVLVLSVGGTLASTTPVHADPAPPGPLGGPLLTGTGVISAGAIAPPPVSAASYVLADLDGGQVLAAKDPHGRYAPASTLKTLTALTLIPRLDPASMVSPARDDIAVDGSKVGLVTQLSYSVKDLFTAMLVVSGNDAAGTLATAAGGQQVATGLMNEEAVRLQAGDTHAVNTSGLDAAGQVSSAYDLALIARAGMALPDFRTYVAIRRTTIPAPGGATIEIDNHDKLLGTYAGAIGIKNGFTEAARASFVAAATRDGHTLVVALMRADPAVWKEAAAMLDWGFAATARGAQPVGRLVDPQPLAPAAGPARPAPSAAAAPPANVSRARAGSSPALPVAGVVGLLGLLLVALLLVGLLLVGLRRRAVVKARTRRRALGRRVRPAPHEGLERPAEFSPYPTSAPGEQEPRPAAGG